MPIKVKWDISGKGDGDWGEGGMSGYTGPTPPKGSYVARVKRMTIGKIKTPGDNQGKPRIAILLEIVSGSGAESIDDEKYKYRGAPIWDGLNIIKSQTTKSNNFVHALTDGSKAAKDYIEDKFWPPNMDIKADKVARRDGTEDVHIKRIGRYEINSPEGQALVRVVTKMGTDLHGEPRAEVSMYLPYTGPMPASYNGQNKPEEDDMLEGDLLEEVKDDDIFEEVEDPELTEVPADLDEEPPF